MKVIDSSGWIQYFMNGPLSERYAGFLERNNQIITPTIVFYEVYKKIKNELNEEHALMAAAQLEKTTVVALSQTIAYKAADISIAHKLPMADSIVYATALLNDAQLITSDADFKSLPKVKYISDSEER